MVYYGPWITPDPVTVTGQPILAAIVGQTASDAAGTAVVSGGVGLEWSSDQFPGSAPSHTVSETHWWIDFSPLLPHDVAVTLTPEQVLAGVDVEYDPADTDRMEWLTTTAVGFTVTALAVNGPTLLPLNTVTLQSDSVTAAAHPRSFVETGSGTGLPVPWVGPANVAALIPANVGPSTLDSTDEPLEFAIPTAAISHPDVSTTGSPLALVSFLVHSHAAGLAFPTVAPDDGWEHWAGLRSTVGGSAITTVGGSQFLPAVSWTYQPRRWRLSYPSRPPLAHRQRADGTATAGPQLAHLGTTGGRPPLAWRQNNP